MPQPLLRVIFKTYQQTNCLTKPWREIVYPSGQNYFSSQPLATKGPKLAKYIIFILLAMSNVLTATESPSVTMTIEATCEAEGDFYDTRVYKYFDIIIEDNSALLEKYKDRSLEIVNKDNVLSPRKYRYNKKSNNSNGKILGYVTRDKINQLDSLLNNTTNLQLNAKKSYTVKEKTNEETWQSKMQPKSRLTFKNGKMINVKLNPKKTYKTKNVTKYKNTYFNIKVSPNEWTNAKNTCSKQVSKDKMELNIKYIAIIIAILFGLFILYIILKNIKKFIIKKISIGKEKLIEIKKEKEEQRIRNIAEDESIRASVKKTMLDSSKEELQDLQKLINNAIAKGDSETAQTLLKILEKKKNE